jgi:hypothetical protein
MFHNRGIIQVKGGGVALLKQLVVGVGVLVVEARKERRDDERQKEGKQLLSIEEEVLCAWYSAISHVRDNKNSTNFFKDSIVMLTHVVRKANKKCYSCLFPLNGFLA